MDEEILFLPMSSADTSSESPIIRNGENIHIVGSKEGVNKDYIQIEFGNLDVGTYRIYYNLGSGNDMARVKVTYHMGEEEYKYYYRILDCHANKFGTATFMDLLAVDKKGEISMRFYNNGKNEKSNGYTIMLTDYVKVILEK